MNEQQNALKVFSEELGELAIEILELQKQVSKAMRFGIDEQRDLPTSNRERIEAEWNDLLGSMQNLQKHGIDLTPNVEAIIQKLGKIDKYTTYSKALGTVIDSEWNHENIEPTEKGWYTVKRADGSLCIRAWGNDSWWIPLTDGWLSGLPAGFQWLGPIASIDWDTPGVQPSQESAQKGWKALPISQIEMVKHTADFQVLIGFTSCRAAGEFKQVLEGSK
jgi:hypothetical protein